MDENGKSVATLRDLLDGIRDQVWETTCVLDPLARESGAVIRRALYENGRTGGLVYLLGEHLAELDLLDRPLGEATNAWVGSIHEARKVAHDFGDERRTTIDNAFGTVTEYLADSDAGDEDDHEKE